jgi:hypothetical protein
MQRRKLVSKKAPDRMAAYQAARELTGKEISTIAGGVCTTGFNGDPCYDYLT